MGAALIMLESGVEKRSYHFQKNFVEASVKTVASLGRHGSLKLWMQAVEEGGLPLSACNQ